MATIRLHGGQPVVSCTVLRGTHSKNGFGSFCETAPLQLRCRILERRVSLLCQVRAETGFSNDRARTGLSQVSGEKLVGEMLRAGRRFRAAAQGRNAGAQEPDEIRRAPVWPLAVELAKWLQPSEEASTFDPASRDQAALQRLAGFRVWMVTMQLFMKELNCSLEDLLLRYDHAYRTCARMTPGKVPEPAVYPADLGEVHRRQAILFGLLFSMYWAPPASEIRPRSLPVLRGLECQRDTATVIDRIDSGSGYKGVVSPFAFTARLDVPEGYSVARAQARQSAARVFVEQPEREFVIVVIADEDRVEFRRVGRLPDGNLSDHLMSPVLLNLDKFDENNKGLQMFWEALYLPPHTLGYPEWPKQMALGDSTITITNSGFLDWSRDFGYCIFKGKEAARRLGRRNAGEESRTDEDVYVAFYTSAHLRNKAVDNLLTWPGGDLRTAERTRGFWESAPFPYYLVVGGAATGSNVGILLALKGL